MANTEDGASTSWRTHWRHLWNQILPSSCAICGQPGRPPICKPCREEYFSSSVARCHRCALRLVDAHDSQPHLIQHRTCTQCMQAPPEFESSVAAFSYAPPLDQLVLALKFGHQLALADFFAEILRNAVLQQTQFELPDLLTVVPLGPQRLIERGFNQALEIGKPFAKLMGIPLLPDLLERARDTLPQSSLPLESRILNMRNAFQLNFINGTQVRDKHVGVIDDVMTSGITYQEIAHLLKEHGASKVTNLVIARTEPNPV